MKKQIIALLMTALLVAGSIPVTAGATEGGENKGTNTTEDSQGNNTSDPKNNDTKGITDKSNAKTSKGSLSSNTKQKETDKKSKKTSDTKTDKTNTKNTDTNKLSNGKENSENQQTNKEPIAISTLEELQKIGAEDGYPLDGTYELQNDIDAKALTGLPEENQEGTEQTDIQKITWKPIGTRENPFTGTLNGNGHLILNLTIAPEKGDAAFFESFEGTIKDLAFINLHSISKTGNAALFASYVNQAEMDNVLLNGKTELQNLDGSPYVAVSKNEAANVKARKENTKAENQTAVIQGQTATEENQTTQADTKEKRLNGDIILEEKDSTYKDVKFIGELQGKLPEGVKQIRTNPEYLSMMKGEKQIITAPELPFGLQFSTWSLSREIESAQVKAAQLELSDQAGTETEVIGKSAGKELLKAVYQYGETTFSIDSPVVIGEIISEVEELKPVDNVFYGQLEVVAELTPIDGVFPKWMKEKAPNINNDSENEEEIELHSWEDFKNIGNTQYNPSYTMDAKYILMNDIVSDGMPFTPIGTKENPFMGSFKGQNFMIDVTLNPEIDVNTDYKGLFGVVK